MKTFVISIAILLVHTAVANAQDIEATLSGNTMVQGFTVRSNTGTPLFTVRGDGKIGLGILNPDVLLHVAGQVKITGGSPGAGKVLTSDTHGLASWTMLSSLPPSGPAGGDLTGTYPNPAISSNAVTSAKIANGAVTPAKISSTGAVPGQMIKYDGTNVVWASPASGGGTLDQAYDFGGAGVGRTITADAGAVVIAGVDGFLVTAGTTTQGAISASGGGARMMWYPKKRAFRAGYVDGTQWDDVNIGLYSNAMGYGTTASGSSCTAMGYGTTASGTESTAMGRNTTASGDFSTAMGRSTTASGNRSTAMGSSTTASGEYSTAMGYNTTAVGNRSTAMGSSTTANATESTAMGVLTTASGGAATAMGAGTTASGLSSTAMGSSTTASGSYSVAMGRNTTASGSNSTAMGSYVSTNTRSGAFIIGDASTTTVFNSSLNNQMSMRFAGGYRLCSNSNLTTGVYMNAGVSGWTNYCDRNRKENFSAIDGETILARLRALPVLEWNYKGADASVRYIGPMAQDFWQAFRLGGTDSLGINSISIDGVNMAAIQALEKRTTERNEDGNEREDGGTEREDGGTGGTGEDGGTEREDGGTEREDGGTEREDGGTEREDG
jgi:hypothetical protein